jgi:putative flippase GtrA
MVPKPEDLAQFARFLVVGVSNTLLTLGIVLVLIRWAGVPYVAANVIGYVAGFLNSFVWNRAWTFKSKGRVSRQAIVYTLVWGASYSLQLGAVVLLREWLAFAPELATVGAIPFFTVANYLGNRAFTFAER